MMRMKSLLLTAACLLSLSASAWADDYSILKPAVEETQRDVAELTALAPSLADSDGSVDPSQPPLPPGQPGNGGDCTFCDNATLENEGNTNQALGILQEVAGSLVKAMNHILALPTSAGQDYNFNKSFACSYTGDAAIDIGSASLALGYPKNLNKQWKDKEVSSVTRLNRARQLAFCP